MVSIMYYQTIILPKQEHNYIINASSMLKHTHVILCIAIQGGIRITFEVHSQIFQSKSSVEMLELLRNSIYNLSQSIKTAWKLAIDVIPNINVIDLVGEDEKISQLQNSIVVKR